MHLLFFIVVAAVFIGMFSRHGFIATGIFAVAVLAAGAGFLSIAVIGSGELLIPALVLAAVVGGIALVISKNRQFRLEDERAAGIRRGFLS